MLYQVKKPKRHNIASNLTFKKTIQILIIHFFVAQTKKSVNLTFFSKYTLIYIQFNK